MTKIASGAKLQMRELEVVNQSDSPDVHSLKLALAPLMEVALNVSMIPIANGVLTMSFVINSLILVEINQVIISLLLALVLLILNVIHAEKLKDANGVK